MAYRARQKLTVPFGIKDGRLVFVTEVGPGLACGCTCPECGAPLIARNQDFPGRKRVRHFQHARASSCPGGAETALHRMAKEVLSAATEFLLPRWASGDVAIGPELLAISSSRLEVPLLGGVARPDVLLNGLAADIEFTSLCVEIRVHHAVSELKRELLGANGLDAIEIDLSDLDESTLADPVAFRYEVLNNAANRCWLSLASGRYIAQRTKNALIEVEDTTVTERVITTKAGRPYTVREQWAFLVKPGSREPVRIQLPDLTVGEVPQPYPRGLHTIAGRSFRLDPFGRLCLRYKTYLEQIEMNPSEPDGHQQSLFGSDQGAGTRPGFRVRMREWKGRPGC